MGASPCLDGADAGGGGGFLGGQELGVFAREDVVGYGGEVVFLAQGEAEGQHEGGFAGADGAEGGVSGYVIVGFGWGGGMMGV